MTFLLELANLHYGYPGQPTAALQGASLQIARQRKIAVIGRNGSGKSTLFLHCNGILRPTQGKVYFAGQPLSYNRQALRELRQKVALIFQNPEDQLFSASVFQDLSFGPLNLGLNPAEVERRVKNVAELCEVTELLARPTHALSGGEKTRVALAGILAMEPELIVADELISSLDTWMRRQVFTIFQRLIKQGKTILLATHDLEVAQNWADLVVVIDSGKVFAFDSPEKIFSNAAVIEMLNLNEPWYIPFAS